MKEKTKNKMLTLINYEYLKKVNSTHLNLWIKQNVKKTVRGKDIKL